MNPGDGLPADANGKISLRAAIEQANANGGARRLGSHHHFHHRTRRVWATRPAPRPLRPS